MSSECTNENTESGKGSISVLHCLFDIDTTITAAFQQYLGFKKDVEILEGRKKNEFTGA